MGQSRVKVESLPVDCKVGEVDEESMGVFVRYHSRSDAPGEAHEAAEDESILALDY